MTKAILFDNYGDANVLKLSEIEDTKPGPNDILIKQLAIGVNFHDILHRRGTQKYEQNPKITGFEAAGVIEDIGDNVKNFRIGDQVVYATAPAGAYRRHRCLHHNYIINIPEGIDLKLIAACFFKGLVAHTLLFRTYSVRENDTIVIHSAASGVGSIMTKWASSIGINVVGTVGSEEKKEAAIKNGCSHVFDRSKDNWVQEIINLTNGRGAHIIYDSVGMQTYNASLQALSKFGFLVLYGSSSGEVVNIDMKILKEKSLFISTPSMTDYKNTKNELIMTAEEIFSKIKEGIFDDQISATYALEDAARAHQLIESGKSTNSIVLI